ncbi:hypothetical protein PIIN_08582 [Serendipita indica DSM 11827]|uniref:Transposase family Tnp2 protein n=1 Tax=Serendipita indica (strain DSM 11827) TaxID=1109443 RepID=G4TTI7_SERID|nr:hypothetical protein PIIN_08582 [Serendipita indica DSM 11827]
MVAPIDYSPRQPLPDPPAGFEYPALPDIDTRDWLQFQRRPKFPHNQRCTFQLTPDSKPCGARLINHASSSGIALPSVGVTDTALEQTSILYTYRSLGLFLKRVTSTPQILTHLVESTSQQIDLVSGSMDDIMNSPGVQTLRMPSGVPFVAKVPGELRLCLGLFVDWYNARQNNLRGSVHSTGGVYIVILNLPRHLRFQQQYMYELFIPGPREPTTEQLNNLLYPIVEDLNILYTFGIDIDNNGYTKCRAMLALVTADQLAARKIGGYAGVGHRWFCPHCRLPRSQLTNELERIRWARGVTQEAYQQITLAWRDAPNEKAQRAIFDRYGFRYTELSRLPYFDVRKQIVIEPFHAILTNIAQPHCRHLIGEIRGLPSTAYLFDDSLDSAPEEQLGSDHNSSESSSEADNQDDGEKALPGESILHQPEFAISDLNRLFRQRQNHLIQLYRQCGLPWWHLNFQGNRVTKQEIVFNLAKWMLDQGKLFTDPDQGFLSKNNALVQLRAWHPPGIKGERLKELDTISPKLNPILKQELRADLALMVFPAHLAHDKPPSNLGSKSHGTLKAAQWRIIYCFGLLVTLGRHWGNANAPQEHQEYFRHFIHLVIIIRIAYSRQLTQSMIANFHHHCTKYVHGVQTTFPQDFMKPSHHYLLHLSDFLSRFGPVPDWWAFAFERHNGFIQRTNTNNKRGEVELSFDRRMSRLSNMGQLLQSSSLPALKWFAEHKIKPGDTTHTIKSAAIGLPETPSNIPLDAVALIALNAAKIQYSLCQTFTWFEREGLKFECLQQESKATRHLIHYSATDIHSREILKSAGYITNIFRLKRDMHASWEPTLYICVTPYKPAENQPSWGEDVDAYLYSYEKQPSIVCNIMHVELKPVVFYPWSKDVQLIMPV